jgi:hypothetical protein
VGAHFVLEPLVVFGARRRFGSGQTHGRNRGKAAANGDSAFGKPPRQSQRLLFFAS